MAVLTARDRDREGFGGGAADGSTAVFELLEDELDAVAVRVYQLRVTHPTALVSQLAARAGCTAEDVAGAERLLSRLGLLQPSPGGGWVAVSPESAAESLLAPLEQDILQRRIAMAATREQLLALSGDYLEARSMRSAKSSIEIVEGLDNVRSVIDDLARTCAESLDALIPGGGENEAAVGAARPLDLELLSRGVRIRSLFQHAALRHRVIAQYVETITSAGAEVRSLSVLPSRVLIYDGACALLPLDARHTSAGAALVRDPAVLSFLSRLFEHCWSEGEEFAQPETAGRDGAPSGLDREVLLLMAGGRTNEEIARRLGVSQRSVSRIVAQLMTRLGATNRFQAGTRAALNGWLT
ncbi:LuxR C-terminal-related transcriptional regulator [Streptomyces sp. URMC 129]|uniref:LuxR C-terminal-related transcriptional regulator n=1 Tax=Streptomyces sp. URMC 129 TaxID=3423407 RepID=UPI003F1C33A6